MKLWSRVNPDLLSSLVPLNALRPDARNDLARKAEFVAHKPGDRLFHAGEIAAQALYLIEGEIELQGPRGDVLATLRAGEAGSEHRLAHQSPRTVSAICRTAVRVLSVDAHLLDVMLTWDQTDALQVGELSPDGANESGDWMIKLLQMPSFQMIPPANLQAMFLRMQWLDCQAGQLIIRQGEPGDYFYVVKEGRCVVLREQPNQKPLRLAELDFGACFGEEALIADGPRNATVVMLTHGTLMRLSKEDFRELLKEPLTRRLTREEGALRVSRNEARYLDVRVPSEFHNHHLPGSLNIPLYMLRMKLGQLDAGISWICVCDTGRRSSVAAFVLNQKGYAAYTLERGV
jgi:CRP-like cAMP-binding protein